MILQDIVISPDVIDKFKKESQSIDSKSYWENIDYKRILFDKKDFIFSEIKKGVQDSDKSLYEIVHKKILDSIRFENKSKLIDIKSPKKFSNDELTNVLLNTVLLSDSKILNTENSDLKVHIRLFEGLKELEILNISEIVEAPPTSRLYNKKRDIFLYKDDFFKIHEVLKHYFFSTKKLIICDKYIIDKRSGYYFLFHILEECKNLEHLEIWTEFDDKKNYFASLSEVIDDLKKQFKERIKNNKFHFKILESLQDQHKRHIYTDDFDIMFDKGLNFLNKKYFVKPHTTDIIIRPRDEKVDKSIRNMSHLEKVLFEE